MAKKKAVRKAHSEVRWALKYGKMGFGNVLVHKLEDFVSNTHGKPCKVTVTEILPAKRKAKR